MKKILLLLSLGLTGSFSYADSLSNSHWTLKSIQCKDSPSSKLPSKTRYDLHFLSESKVEIAILRLSDWVAVRGQYVLTDSTQLCLNMKETILSGNPTESDASTWCVDYKKTLNSLSLTWVVTAPNGGDCAQNIPVTATFEAM